MAVTKRYGAVTPLAGIDLAIEDGEFLVLLGPSGCGKSTLLKIIAGLEDATEGEIYIDGRLANYVRPADRDVAMVFQNYALYPHMTVERQHRLPAQDARRSPRTRSPQRVAEVAAAARPRAAARRGTGAALGRAAAAGRARPGDHPRAGRLPDGRAALQPRRALRVQMREELLQLHAASAATTIYVTHDQIEAMTMGDRIVVMRDGVVQQVGHDRRRSTTARSTPSSPTSSAARR